MSVVASVQLLMLHVVGVSARVTTNKAATAAGTAVIIWLQSQSDLQSVPAVVSHRARELAARLIFLNTAVQT